MFRLLSVFLIVIGRKLRVHDCEALSHGEEDVVHDDSISEKITDIQFSVEETCGSGDLWSGSPFSRALSVGLRVRTLGLG